MEEKSYLERFMELTERQKEVLSYVCQGMIYREVGKLLIISKATVTSHMGHIYETLGLDHLQKNQRVAALFEHYCPLLKEHPPVVIVGEEGDEDEEMEPVSPEVQQMVEEDENALVVWKAAPAVEVISPSQDPPRRRNFGYLWIFVGIILGVGLFGGILYFTGHLPVSFGNVQATGTQEEMTSSADTPEATQTAYVIVVTATSPPVTETSIPTDTLPPTETPTPSITTNYTYDAANRLTSVDSTAYTWDNNGNLLNDGTNTYTYDSANRLTGLTDGQNTYTFVYNGLGDRVQQAVNGVTTTYVLDLNAGLTQVLSDGMDTYLYGLTRIGEEDTSWDYYLPDALGSVRQLTDSTAAVTLAQTFEPYGKVWASYGNRDSNYDFANEWTSQGLIYLRARYYDPGTGRFLTRDLWNGNSERPSSYNFWLYGYSNPIRYIDPSGLISEEEAEEAEFYVNLLKGLYNVRIRKDWGIQFGYLDIAPILLIPCGWNEGNWKSVDELKLVTQAVIMTSIKMGGSTKFNTAMKNRPIHISRVPTGEGKLYDWLGVNPDTAHALPPIIDLIYGDIVLPDKHFSGIKEYSIHNIIHEIGHEWDMRENFGLTIGLMQAVKTSYDIKSFDLCLKTNTLMGVNEFIGNAICASSYWGPGFSIEPQPGIPDNQYAAGNNGGIFTDDWSESFANYIYPTYFSMRGWLPIGEIREKYIENIINGIP